MSRNTVYFFGLLLLAGCEWGGVPIDETLTDEDDGGRTSTPDFPGGDSSDEEADRIDAKAVWGPRDDPSLFADDLEYRLAELPQSKTLEQGCDANPLVLMDG